MEQKVPVGTWVQVERTILMSGERSKNLPEETRECPLVLWVKGFLLEEAGMGQVVEIRTIIGRRQRGRLFAVNPPYEHNFGKPITELLTVGEELRNLLV
jgi:hypothetical protein